MRRVPLVPVACAAVLILCAPAATALSFGRTQTATTLGQRLDFVAHLVVDADETIAPQCVSAEVMFGDRTLAAGNVVVALGERAGHPRASGSRDDAFGGRRAGRHGRRRRRLHVPGLAPLRRIRRPAAPPPRERPAGRCDAEPAARCPQLDTLADIVRAADASRRAAPRAKTARDSGAARDAPPRAGARATAAARSSAQPPGRVPRGGARTGRSDGSLEATRRAGVDRTRADASPAAGPACDSLSGSAAGGAGFVAARPPVRRRRKPSLPRPRPRSPTRTRPPSISSGHTSEELEAGLARVRAEAQAQQKTVGALQARLREAEAGQYANGLVYALPRRAVLRVARGGLLGAPAPATPARPMVRRAGAAPTRGLGGPAACGLVRATEERRARGRPAPSRWGGSGHGSWRSRRRPASAAWR